MDETLDTRTILHAKIIRDADKLDIIALHLDYFEQREHTPQPGLEASFSNEPGYSSEIIDLIMQSSPIPHALRKNYNDFILTQLAWLLDLNFPYSFRYALEHAYVEKILTHLPAEDRIRNAGDHVRAEITRREKIDFISTADKKNHNTPEPKIL